jgi:cold shock CspA family protein
MPSSKDAETLARLDASIAEIPLADHPYHASLVITGLAVDVIDSDVGGDLYQMWSVLQDWYDLREEDAAEALDAIRQAALEWPAVKDDPAARIKYFARWRSTVRSAFRRPRRPAGPDSAVIGPVDGEVVDYEEKAGFGFIRPDTGGPTYFFRWNEIESDAYFKTVEVGARVRFEARVSHAGERYALRVLPQGWLPH